MDTNTSDTATVKDLMGEIEAIKQVLKDLYIPQHFDNMMTKIGKVESSVSQAEKHTVCCYNTLLAVFVVFVALVTALCYIVWKIDYWRAFLRVSNFSTYNNRRRTRRYYSTRKTPPLKNYASAPEQGYSSDWGHCEAVATYYI